MIGRALSRGQTAVVYSVEGINSFATTLYFYYAFFFTENVFGFTKIQNLTLAALMGLAYAGASTFGGRFAQRHGYFTALKCGFIVMALAIGTASFAKSLPVHLAILFVSYAGAACTWPSLEALVCEGQSRRAVQRNLGIYNCVWGGTAAIAYFCGGALIQFGGFKTQVLLVSGLNVLQLLMVFALERSVKRAPGVTISESDSETYASEHAAELARSPVSPQTFLRMAWLSNPFGYLAINTVIAVVPNLAQRLELSIKEAGNLCSIWLFVRTGAFLLLWLWPGWHYRFRWLNAAFITMTASFVTLLVATSLWMVIVAQIGFGLALGLIYYSSLYYSMDVGDTKGEHGGFHEAMIGLGSFAGPAIGAAGLFMFPRYANASTWAAAALLGVGLATLSWMRWRR